MKVSWDSSVIQSQEAFILFFDEGIIGPQKRSLTSFGMVPLFFVT